MTPSILVSVSSESISGIESLFWIATVVALSPLLVRLTRGLVPDVVVLLALGCVIGPSVLDLAGSEAGVELLREIGLGLLFLIAGSEIDPATLRASQGRHAALTWLLCLMAAFGLAWAVIPEPGFSVALVFALAITSTALGALLPIVRERSLLGTPLGTSVLTHGAIGEVGPILVMAVLLGSRSTVATAGVLVVFLAVTVLVAVVPRAVVLRVPGVRTTIVDGMDGTGQTGMRLVFWLLLSLMAAAAVFELDVVLGAFAAGFILRTLQPQGSHFLDDRVEIVAWSFLVPVFFVTSGMGIELSAIAGAPVQLIIVVLTILVVRGGIVWARERWTSTGSGLTGRTQQAQLGLYAAAGLPIIVAVTELATARDLMPDEVAAVLVAAGALTLLFFPLLARAVGRTKTEVTA